MSERAQLLLELADDELILGWRDSEWTGIAPFLEEDVAFSSIAQNEIGHARALYELAARDLGGDADSLAFDRRPEEYRCAPLVQARLVRRLGRHDRAPLPLRDGRRDPARGAEVARTTPSSPGSRRRSTARRSTTASTPRCGSKLREEPRFLDALDRAVAARARRSSTPEQRPALAAAAWAEQEVEAVERAAPGAEFAELWDEMTMVRRSAPAGAQW